MEEKEKKEIEYVCLICGTKMKKEILEKKIHCLNCESNIFKKERDPTKVRKIIAR